MTADEVELRLVDWWFTKARNGEVPLGAWRREVEVWSSIMYSVVQVLYVLYS